MKVRELVDFLSGCDEEAEVLLVTSPSWPFEAVIADARVREDLSPAFSEGAEHGRPVMTDRDVLLFEGRQVRYAPKGR